MVFEEFFQVRVLVHVCRIVNQFRISLQICPNVRMLVEIGIEVAHSAFRKVIVLCLCACAMVGSASVPNSNPTDSTNTDSLLIIVFLREFWMRLMNWLVAGDAIQMDAEAW